MTHCARFDRNHSVVALPSAHGQAAINGRAEHDAFVIIGMIAEQFDAPWRVGRGRQRRNVFRLVAVRGLLETSRRQEYAFGLLRKVYTKRAAIRGQEQSPAVSTWAEQRQDWPSDSYDDEYLD